MIYAPEVLVYHAHALTFRTFWRRHFNYGRVPFRFREARVCRDQDRIKLEPFSFHLGLPCYPFLQARGWQALSLAPLLVVAQVANAVGFLWEYVDRSMEKSPGAST